jgi:N-acetylmuramoyl-L-alanine amidase
VRARTTIVAAACLLAATSASAEAAARYTVRWGDTLSGIARAHHTTLRALARLNGLNPYGILQAGSVLRLSGHGGAGHAYSTYVVQPGDTLTWIAERHGMSLSALARLNHRPPYAVLVIGTRLRVPVGGGVGGTVSSSAAAASGGIHWRGRYTVQPGDTLSALAARFGTTAGRLAAGNHMQLDDLLLSGITIDVPLHGHRAVSASRSSVLGSIDRWSAYYGVSPSLVRAVAWQESGFQPDVTSKAGAWGVMQIMPTTWTFGEQVLIGAPVPHTADGNVRIGVAYLHDLLLRFGGDARLAVAAYYQGPRAVRRFGVLPQSRGYVDNVLRLWGVFGG